LRESASDILAVACLEGVESLYELLLSDEAPTISTFWRGGSHSTQMTVNTFGQGDELIAETEKRFGIRLPERLKALYRLRNGGYTDYRFYPKVSHPRPVFDDWNCMIIDNINPVDRLETLGELSDAVDFGDDDECFRNRFADTDLLIVLSQHGWDFFLCLDYRASGPQGEPEVISLEEGESGVKEVLRVPNFETFLAGLRREASSAG
jgi:hypothetical protein